MKSILSLLLFSIMSSTAFAEPGPSVLDQGLDGTVRYYNVVCPSNKRTALSYDFKAKETCVTFVNGGQKEVCKLNWDKDNAAKEACK